MKQIYFFITLFLLSPFAAFAAPRTIQEFGNAFLGFLNETLMTFLFAIALLVFIYNVIRYFIVKVNSYDGQEQAKKYLIWSIIGFVLIVSLWGVVNLFVGGLGLGRELPICPDYLVQADPTGKACRNYQNNHYDATSPSSLSLPSLSDEYTTPTIAPTEGVSLPTDSGSETSEQRYTPPTLPDSPTFPSTADSEPPQQFDPALQSAFATESYDLLTEYVTRLQEMGENGNFSERGVEHYIKQVVPVLQDPSATYEEKKRQIEFTKGFVSNDTYVRTMEAFEAMYASTSY